MGAGNKGNPFSKTWWTNMKTKLTRMCGEGDFDLEKVCCHEAFAPKPERRPCHIPWAHLEWLKQPLLDSDARGEPKLDPTKKNLKKGKSTVRNGAEAEAILAAVAKGRKPAIPIPDSTRMFCFRGPEGMAAHVNGEVYWQHWDAKKAVSIATKDSGRYDVRFDCREDKGDLYCDAGNWGKGPRRIQQFFGRIAYHLFFSTRRPHVKKRSEVFQAGWLLADLYQRSLNMTSGVKK